MKLYHYAHCPFCVRVRFALGLLNINYESIILPYDDEETPKKLMGVKMLPILSWRDNDVSNESLDIISRLDERNILQMNKINEDDFNELESLLNEIGKNVHPLCMPYWMWTPEFNDKSRKYFQTKKEQKRGPFKNLIQNRDQYLKSLQQTLNSIECELAPFYQSDIMTIFDICIASHLWGMYIFPEFQFSPKMHAYLQSIKNQSNFDYHKDFWL